LSLPSGFPAVSLVAPPALFQHMVEDLKIDFMALPCFDSLCVWFEGNFAGVLIGCDRIAPTMTSRPLREPPPTLRFICFPNRQTWRSLKNAFPISPPACISLQS